METMQLITTRPSAMRAPQDLTTLDDSAIEAIFAEVGLSVEVVAHCADVSCPACFGRRPARAA